MPRTPKPLPHHFTETTPQPIQETKLTGKMRVAAFVLTIGGLLFGYDTGVINGALPSMAVDFDMPTKYEGFVTSALQFGAIFGAIFGGRFSDRYGRHRTVLIVAMLFTVAAVGSVLSPTWWVLSLFRIVLGLAVGGASVTVPVYLAELAPTHLRGRVISQNEFMVVLGQLLAFGFNAGIAGVAGSDQAGTWRWMLAICIIPAIVLWAGMIAVPESPRWLARGGRIDEMLSVLRQVREHTFTQAEVDEVRTMAERDEQAASGTLKDIFGTTWIRRILFIGIGMAIINQISGINVVQYYGVTILTDAGFVGNTAFVVNLLIGLAGVIGVGVALAIVPHVRRKMMLSVGLTGTIVMLSILALSSMLIDNDVAAKRWIVLASIVIFVGISQCAIGTMTWLYMSEIYPLPVRGIAMGVSTGVQWSVNFLVALFFPLLSAAIGFGATIGIFVVLQIIALTWVRIKVPETKDKSLEMIEEEFRGRVPAAS
ncbi:sugar porter family MFS transporter [Curtobacterium sp. S6]|uniref:sugar porter family MFS transporter n=1 Tax=Curtobacterium sp. S6 TaxID=1479623 RepID=UPI001F178A73|nr:sugar porter family MFS transporter [Curtobacterium sp. S6]